MDGVRDGLVARIAHMTRVERLVLILLAGSYRDVGEWVILKLVCASRDSGRRLRHRLPEFGIVAEDDAPPAPFQRLRPVKRGQRRLAVVHVARQGRSRRVWQK